MLYWKFALFSLAWIAGVYLFNCLLARKFKSIVWSRALVYVSTVAMLGLFGEIFVDTLYNIVTGTPLWRYNLWPIHHAYTSSYAAVLWAIYGFYLYMLHDNLRTKWSVQHGWHLALIFSLEALIIEALVEITSKVVFGEYIYYYYPNGLWHISAFQNFPFYLICGCIIVVTVRQFLALPWYFILFNTWLVAMIIWVI